MITPDYYDHITDRIIDLYAELDNAIIADVARRIIKTGEITGTAEWQIRQLQQNGMLYDDILKEISRQSGQNELELRRIFKDAGMESIKNDNIIYSAAGKGKINLTAAGMQVLNAGFKKCNGSLNNLTLTTANTSQLAFINACNAAYMQVTSGAFDYNTAIRNAIKAVAQSGSEVLYPSGHRDKIDVAVRRAVLTGVGQTCRTLTETNAEEMNCDLMEITAHAGARPSHAEWQGQIVSLSGRKGYLSKSDIGYGTGDGFGGWNCRHDWYPFFEGYSNRAYGKKELEALNARNISYNGKMYTEYEISQMQRKMERDIRSAKRELTALNAAIKESNDESLTDELQSDFIEASVNLKSHESNLKQFLKETHQKRDNAREQVVGFGRTEAQKAVWANKKEFDKYKCIRYNKNGTIVVTDDFKNKKNFKIPKKYKPNAVIETQTTSKDGLIQIERTIYGENAIIKTQIHSGNHGKPKNHPYGKNGEHHHYYIWEDGKDYPLRNVGELTDEERKEHSDIL